MSEKTVTSPADITSISDYSIIDAVLDGQTELYELLMRRHNQRLYRLARSVVCNESEAEDIVQETFVRAFEALSRFQRRASFITWISRIAYHEALKRRRLANRARHHQPKFEHRQSSALPHTDQSILNALNCNEVYMLLKEAFDNLSAVHRSVLMLRVIEGLSTQETAECLRITQSNVKVLLHRAKAQFSGSFDQDTADSLREQFSFAGHRCDRNVSRVLSRIKPDQEPTA